MKKIHPIIQRPLLAGVFVCVLCSLAIPLRSVPIPTLHGTGVDNNHALLAGGTVDSHYQLISSADPSFPGPAAIVGGPVCSVWIANGPNSMWIGPSTNLNCPSAFALSNYTYRTTFDLTGYDPATVVITGSWAADNYGVNILINGTSTGNATPPQAFSSFHAFSITNGFGPGTNTLDFVVYNESVTTGLRVEMNGTAAFSPPLLDITSAGNQVALYWPAWASYFVLESTTNLSSPNWMAVTNGTPIPGGVSLINTWPARYFRLRDTNF